ncbi:MAG: sigma-70 family RNA polymerase sigma factor [Rhodobacteraceae bacterium]|nr:sigma-70 family RNA polymerase sigma factor [Paracoccaceae bacterium]
MEALWPRLWRFAYGLSKNRHDAEDLAQSACLKALQNTGRFKAGTHVDRWVFTICRNLWLNEVRARKVRTGNGCIPIDDDNPLVEKDRNEANIFAAQVLSQVMALPDAQRETVLLVYIEGFAYKEAAAILDIPIGTVMSRLAAARKALAPMKATKE